MNSQFRDSTNQVSIYYIENHIFSTPPFGDHIFPPCIYLQECKNQHIFDHFVLVFEEIVFINFHFLSPSALSAIFIDCQKRHFGG